MGSWDARIASSSSIPRLPSKMGLQYFLTTKELNHLLEKSKNVTNYSIAQKIIDY
jgi:hypothetical protein